MKCLQFWAYLFLVFFYGITMPQIDVISTDRVFYRFYLINRLQPSRDLFSRLMREKHNKKNNPLEKILCSFDQMHTALFVHPILQANIRYMCTYHDSAPLIKLIKTVGHYRYLYDDEYVREVVMLLIVVYKNLLQTIAPEKEIIIDENIPLSSLLDILDTTVDTIENVFAQKKSSRQSWLPHWLPMTPAITLLAGAATWLLYQK